MVYIKKPFWVLCTLACSALSVKSQTVSGNDTLHASLPEVWQKAEAYSRAVKIKKQSVAVGVEEVKDAQTERLPDFNVSASAEKATNMPIYDNGLFNAPSEHEIIHTLYRVGTDFYLNIYNGNKLNLKIEEDKTLLKIERIQQDQTLSDIRYKAAALYLDLQKSVIFQRLIIQDIADQQEQLEEIKAFHKNGVVLKSDVLRVELDLSKRQLALVQIQNDILIANQKLNIVIGEPDERVIQPSELSNPIGSSVPTYNDCLSQALANSFPYLVSQRQTELSRIKLKDVKANVSPKIGTYGEFYYANPQIFLYPYNPYWYSLGVGGIKVSFPLSSIYLNTHKERAAKIEVEKEEEKDKDIQDKVRQQVKEAYLRYTEALVRIDVAKVNVDRAIENERIIKNTYFNNTSLITDLLDADVQLLQTKFELATAEIMAQNKYYLLQNVIGIL